MEDRKMLCIFYGKFVNNSFHKKMHKIFSLKLPPFPFPPNNLHLISSACKDCDISV